MRRHPHIGRVRFHHIALVAFAMLLILAMGLPLFAQDDAVVVAETDGTIILTGAVSFGPAGEIMVGDYIIAPASAFRPAVLMEGDIVIIVGTLLPDGITVQAITFELFDDSLNEDPEATEEPEFTPEPEVTDEPEATEEPTITPEPTDIPVCGNPNHPVIAGIANRFQVGYAEVMALHCDGQGVGNIIRAYVLAEQTQMQAREYLDLARTQGWGAVIRDSGVHPRDLAPGQAIKTSPADTAASDTSASNTGPGNSGNAGRPNNPGGGNSGGGRPDNPGGGNSGGGRPDNPGGGNSGGGRPDNPGGGNSGGRGGKP